MNNNIIIGFIISLIAFTLAGCQSIPGPPSKFNYGNDTKEVSVTLSAPNLSNVHKPPLISLAYIKVYTAQDVCLKKKTLLGEAYQNATPIGEMYVSRADKSKVGSLPVGNIVIQSGFDLRGLTSTMACDRYFQFTTRENFEYEIEVRESRPFVVSCSISIKEKDAEGKYTGKLSDFRQSKDGSIFSSNDDMSPLCEDVEQ